MLCFFLENAATLCIRLLQIRAGYMITDLICPPISFILSLVDGNISNIQRKYKNVSSDKFIQKYILRIMLSNIYSYLCVNSNLIIVILVNR